jgi:hypothetical protein
VYMEDSLCDGVVTHEGQKASILRLSFPWCADVYNFLQWCFYGDGGSHARDLGLKLRMHQLNGRGYAFGPFVWTCFGGHCWSPSDEPEHGIASHATFRGDTVADWVRKAIPIGVGDMLSRMTASLSLDLGGFANRVSSQNSELRWP